MQKNALRSFKVLLRGAVAQVLVAVFAGQAISQQPAESSFGGGAAALLERHAELAARLENNAYGRPLFLESNEGSSRVSGNAYAVLNAPFQTVSATFKSPERWCEVMILHINTKYCRASPDAVPGRLKVNIGKKTPQELKNSYALEFVLRVAASSPDYLAVQSTADKGPLGTRNYQLELQAVPLAGRKTFIQLRYSYGYGMLGRMSMQTYLNTLGSGKLGFTQISDGQGQSHVGGMRGAVERNTMRYYLAIDAYLASLNLPPSQQLDARLEHWFNATEKFPRQLHEIDKSSYLAMKKNEYQRQQIGSAD